MSNNYWEDEDEDLDTDQGFSGDGSDLIKKLRKAKRADEKRIKELTEQLEGLSKVQRERTVKEVLEKKGVNAKAARLILKDIDDVNEETVSNWLDEKKGESPVVRFGVYSLSYSEDGMLITDSKMACSSDCPDAVIQIVNC